MLDNGGAHDQNSPRMRGGQPHVQVQWLYDDAFTPHARGSTHETDTVNSDGMILPACAGVTPSRLKLWPFRQDSPRMRGGQPEEGVRTTKRDGILPAYAGGTLLREWLYEPVYSHCM